jgi:hypothetical protein
MALDFRRKKQWFLIHLSRIATPIIEAVAKLSTFPRRHLRSLSTAYCVLYSR